MPVGQAPIRGAPMRPKAAAFAALLLVCFESRAEEPTPEQKKRIEELKKQIADKKTEIAKLEAELAKLDPVKLLPHIFVENLRVGTAGPFGSEFVQGFQRSTTTVTTFQVVKVIDEQKAVIKVLSGSEVVKGRATHTYGECILLHPTKGLADGGALKPDAVAYRVSGTEKVGEKTYFVVEPYSIQILPPKK